MAFSRAERSVVGGILMSAVAAKDTSATLKLSGSESTNSLAPSFAASSLVGVTSVAIIERDTSMTTTTVARSRGTRVIACGCA